MKWKFPQRWMTIEEPPQFLEAKGVSAFDPDLLVAKMPDNDDVFWLLFNGNRDAEVVTVISRNKGAGAAAHLRAVRLG